MEVLVHSWYSYWCCKEIHGGSKVFYKFPGLHEVSPTVSYLLLSPWRIFVINTFWIWCPLKLDWDFTMNRQGLPVAWRKVPETMTLPVQLTEVAKAMARPLVEAGNISLNKIQTIGPKLEQFVWIDWKKNRYLTFVCFYICFCLFMSCLWDTGLVSVSKT